MPAAESLNPEDSLWHWMAINLRKERKRRKLTQADVAEIIEADISRVSNYEAGRLNLTQDHAEAIDRAWGTMYASLRKYAVLLGRDETWRQQFMKHETGAQVIKLYYARVVPLPFQTEDYARALIKAAKVVQGADDIEKSIRARMSRRKNLVEQLPETTSFWVIVDEGALAPPEFTKAVIREQLEELISLSEHASVRIIPAQKYVHAGIDGSFELLTTAKGRDMAYVWAPIGGRLLTDVSDLRTLALRWERLGAQALTEEASRDLLVQRLERLRA